MSHSLYLNSLLQIISSLWKFFIQTFDVMKANPSVFWGVFILGPGMVLGAPPLNVVMIIADDQSWGDFGFMGYPVIQTPYLDRLASESLVFTRGYVTASLCRPSLGTLLTGLYPYQSKIATNYAWNHPTGFPLAARPYTGSREGEYWRTLRRGYAFAIGPHAHLKPIHDRIGKQQWYYR